MSEMANFLNEPNDHTLASLLKAAKGYEEAWSEMTTEEQQKALMNQEMCAMQERMVKLAQNN